jgi:hypothetical protein
LAANLSFLVGCDGKQKKETAALPEKAPIESRFQEYAIKILTGAERKLVYVSAPATDAPTETSDGGATASSTPLANVREPLTEGSKAPIHLQAKINTGGEEIDIDLANLGTTAPSTLEKMLVVGAAYECGMGSENTGNQGSVTGDPTFYPQLQLFPATSMVFPFNVFQGAGTDLPSCETQLLQEEMLVCIASKLIEIADAVAPIVWQKVPTKNEGPLWGSNQYPLGPWIIPPQSAEDRFIVRDQALKVLTSMMYVEYIGNPVMNVDGQAGNDTCNDLYGEALQQSWEASYTNTNANRLFAVDVGSNPLILTRDIPATYSNLGALVENRIKMKVQVFRTAARLLKEDILEETTYGDIAGGLQQRNHAADPVEGAKRMWGMADQEQQPYNSLAHTAQILTGGGGSDLLRLGYGPSFEARVLDRSPTTRGQERAATLLSVGGIVLPTETTTASMAQIRSAIAAQLTQDDLLHDQTILNELSDEDLRFGLAHTFRAYSQLTEQTADGFWHGGHPGYAFDPDSLGAGLVRGTVVDELEAIDGSVVAGGVPRQDLTVDVMARVAGMQRLTANAMSSSSQDLQSIANGPFFIADLMRRTIGALNAQVERGDLIEFESDTAPTTASALAEVRSWSGPGSVFVSHTCANPPCTTADVPATIKIRMVGFSAADLATTTGSYADHFVLVNGPYWVADCAAKLRQNCPDDFEDDYVMFATNAQAVAVNELKVGTSEPTIELTFPGRSGSVPNFEPVYDPDTHEPAGLYLVQRYPYGQGRVLGAPVLKGSYDTSFAVSDYQRRLLNAAFGIQAATAVKGLTLGGPATALPEDYCIPGVPWDFFVPLENELSEDSDEYENSWRHYLGLARQAAERSDALADQLMQLDKEEAYHVEGAQQDLAATCGGYTDISNVTYTADDKVDTSTLEDTTLKQCIDDERINLVFLGIDAAEDLCGTETPHTGEKRQGDESRTRCIKREILKCDQTDPPVTPRSANCDKIDTPGPDYGVITSKGLNLVPNDDTSEELNPSQCERLPQIIVDLLNPATGYTGTDLGDIGSATWATKERLRTVVDNLRLYVDDDGNWTLSTRGGNGLMASSGSPSNTLWPGCLVNSSCDPTAVALFAPAFSDASDLQSLDSDDKMRWLWRVEGAVWTLAGLAGHAKEGLMELPFPAVNWEGHAPEFQAPVFTVFGHGRFQAQSGGAYVLKDVSATDPEGGVTEDDRTALGEARAIVATNPGYEAGNFNMSNMPRNTPAWLKSVYNSRSNYLHVRASTQEYGFMGSPGELGTYLNSLADVASGMTCGSDFDDYGSGGTADLLLAPFFPSLTNNVAALKQTGGAPGNNHWWVFASIDPTTGEALDTTGLAGIPYIGYVATPVCYAPALGRLDVQWPWKSDPTRAERGDIPGLYDAYNTSEINTGEGTSLMGPWNYHGQIAALPPSTAGHKITGGPSPHEQCGGVWQTLNADCTKNHHEVDTVLGFEVGDFAVTRSVLRPSVCKPSQRAALATNFGPPAGRCDAIAQVLQALTIACAVDQGAIEGANLTVAPPPLDSPDDIPLFNTWLSELARNTEHFVGGLYVDNVPARAIAGLDLQNTSADYRGETGLEVQQIEGAFRDTTTAWLNIASNIRSLRTGMDQLKVDLDLIHLEAEHQLLQNAFQRVGVIKDMVAAISQGVGASWGVVPGLPTFNPLAASAEITNSMLQAGLGVWQLDILGSIDDNTGAQEAVKTQAALLSLQAEAEPLFRVIQGSLISLEGFVSTALTHIGTLDGKQDDALYALAQASGAPYVSIGGEIIPLPVNQVLRAHRDIYRRRYQDTLKQARHLTYFARLAIEQRIGMRLNEITTSVGQLEPPAQWADDICWAIGANYNDAQVDIDLDYEPLLVTYTPPEGFEEDTENEVLEAAQEDRSLIFIGDYVNRLENFVAFYNVQYPSRDAVDVAALSLREDLIPAPPGQCLRPSANELYYSSDLTTQPTTVADDQAVSGGWEIRACDNEGRCLTRTSGTAIPLPEQNPYGGATVLRDVASTGFPEGGIVDTTGDTLGVQPRSVFQRVQLDVGSYALSWWDQARKPSDGGAWSNGTPVAYRVAVRDPFGVAVGSTVQQPFTSTMQRWSPRRSVTLEVETAGQYVVEFGASVAPETLGSVAIANVQLEKLSSADALLVPFEVTSNTRDRPSTNCGLEGAIQRLFQYKCEAARCFYELTSPIVIDTRALVSGQSKLVGKLAQGNFNFRHVDLALNAVGTGVINCDDAVGNNCYGTAELEYSLEHVAFDTLVIDHNNEARYFDFGLAGIRNAKMLAAERFITSPIGSADLELLGQPQFTKPEFRGRPLDGTYRLRVYDSPYLQWGNLEDIQLVLKYLYWSRVSRTL